VNARRALQLAVAAAAAGGAGAYFMLRRKSKMSAEELADYIVKRGPVGVSSYAYDIARAAIDTVPRDYFPQDADAALQRWALLIVAVGDHESAFGNAPGFYPKNDPTGWGDRGNAFGFFQIDKHYHWSFIQSDAAQTVYGQALYAARRILASNWLRFAKVEDAEEREHLTVITYNASAVRVAQMVAQGASAEDADNTTTKTADGTPYGADVLARLERMTTDAAI
jgi:hypothetical protein